MTGRLDTQIVIANVAAAARTSEGEANQRGEELSRMDPISYQLARLGVLKERVSLGMP
jgi:hypothetical protein